MKITEKNFVAQLRRGNERALEYVVDAYGSLLLAVVRKQLALLPELQQECINDVLLAIWQNIDHYDESRSTFANWVAGICRYKAIDCRRVWLKQLQEQPLEATEELADPRRSADLLEQEIFEEVEQMLSCLKETDQILFRQLFVEELPVEVVAENMGISRNAVYNRVSRGRKQLRKKCWIFGKGQS